MGSLYHLTPIFKVSTPLEHVIIRYIHPILKNIKIIAIIENMETANAM